MLRVGLSHSAAQLMGAALHAGGLVCVGVSHGGCRGLLCTLATDGMLSRSDVLCASRGMIAALRNRTAVVPPALTVQARGYHSVGISCAASAVMCGCGRSFGA
ncbi:Iron-sulfur cluster insertion protein ErpA [Candidatus Tremblaya princeps]|uniref:Iron-sulfur cluster insertion protein ErpA n=1 Tax=Tremblaya princeps TaxID=189385 RepID=A0A143WQY3_TREPR|nr:Iron-sulfur cluster insertion protein ErpA [Candidatus Tremblaya princeps]